MAVEAAGVVYIVVVDGDDGVERTEDDGKHSFRYTRSVLQSTLQLMGCKPRHAFKISQGAFKMMPTEYLGESGDSKIHPLEDANNCNYTYVDSTNEVILPDHGDDNFKNQPFESYKKRTTAVINRNIFLDVVCNALTGYKYVGPSQRADLALACRIRERKESVTVLLCGTSGCGKSTLSALLASRLGITRVISTDSIRHMMRSFVDEKQNPLLWASTYHAGEYLDPVAVAEAKSRRKAKKSANIPNPRLITPDLIGPKQMAVEGFKAQAEMVIDSLDRLITSWEEQKESVVVEGVHLNLNFVMDLMKKHPSIIPFMIYISNEEKHLERFAVRAKYMTLDPAKNKYVKYIRNIRAIQEYLGKQADKHLVPKINNTNVDRSVAAIHATVFSCLRRREAGEKLYDPMTNVVAVVDEEYNNQRSANSLSSKGMFQLIQHKGSSRHMMALFNTDGSVAKAWPVNSIDGSGKPVCGDSSENSIGKPMYGPLQIGNAEPVNLQFGNFGISAWPSDVGCTSHTSSVDCHSMRCNSPKIYEGHAKELKEEESVHGSDEDIEELPEAGSDEDLSESEMQIHEEVEGSVDEESNKTDEEYDDLAIQETGYVLDEDEASCNDLISKMIMSQDSLMQPLKEADEAKEEIYKQNLEHFLRTKNEGNLQLPARSYSTLVRERHKQRAPTSSGNPKNQKHSLCIPSLR